MDIKARCQEIADHFAGTNTSRARTLALMLELHVGELLREAIELWIERQKLDEEELPPVWEKPN